MGNHLPDIVGNFLDSSVNLDKTHHEQGFKEGYNDGLAQHGLEIGGKLGFYRGHVDIWTSTIKIDPNRFSSRIQQRIKIMDTLLQQSLSNPEIISVTKILDSLRLELKCVSPSLKVNGFPKASNDNTEF